MSSPHYNLVTITEISFQSFLAESGPAFTILSLIDAVYLPTYPLFVFHCLHFYFTLLRHISFQTRTDLECTECNNTRESWFVRKRKQRDYFVYSFTGVFLLYRYTRFVVLICAFIVVVVVVVPGSGKTLYLNHSCIYLFSTWMYIRKASVRSKDVFKISYSRSCHTCNVFIFFCFDDGAFKRRNGRWLIQ